MIAVMVLEIKELGEKGPEGKIYLKHTEQNVINKTKNKIS